MRGCKKKKKKEKRKIDQSDYNSEKFIVRSNSIHRILVLNNAKKFIKNALFEDAVRVFTNNDFSQNILDNKGYIYSIV